MASYKLPLKSLSLGVQEFKYLLNTEFFNDIEATEVHAAHVEVLVKVDRKNDEIYEMEFTLQGTLTIPCDRCLDDMEHEVDTQYRLSVKEGEAYDDSRDNVLVIPSHWREIDLAPIMRDTVLLTIPIKHVHPDGGCNGEMLDQLGWHSADADSDNLPHHGQETQEEDTFTLGDDPRWEALKKLKDNN